MTNFSTMKCVASLVLLLPIQLTTSITQSSPGCGNIPYCKSYNPDPCNTCSCSDPINNPSLAMCTLAYCPDPTFIPECTSCMDQYTLSNKQCIKPILEPPPALPPSISIAPIYPLPVTPCICTQNYAPVCCSNGKTYSNQCTAICEGLTACKPGECSITAPIEPIIIPQPIDLMPPMLPLPINPFDCEYLPACQNPCIKHYSDPFYRMPSVQCQGYPKAQCEPKVNCSGCYAIFTDEFGKEIDCIPPPIEPITCVNDANCRTWQGFFCRPDIKCKMSSIINTAQKCENVCYDIIGFCSYMTPCMDGYECIEDFCVKYQTDTTPMYVIGRPYNIQNVFDLKAKVKQIDCSEYNFYFNDIKLAIGYNMSVKNELISDWIDRALSEHASIGTFSKFNLDLMSIAAPLWFLKMANNASLDEIRHAKISFDILNMYIKYGNDGSNKCILYDEFPRHELSIDGNYNRISLDAATGGCFGETVSVFLTCLHGYNSGNELIKSYLYEVAMDEIRHASLSWVAVKWIMDERGNKVEVYDINWWKKELLNRNRMVDNVEGYVYKYVIPAIFELLWTENGNLIQSNDYNKLYVAINSLLEYHLKEVIGKL